MTTNIRLQRRRNWASVAPLFFQRVGQTSHKANQYLHRNYVCLTEHPEIFWMRKLGRIEWVREAACLYFQLTSKSESPTVQEHSIFGDINAAEIAAQIREEGVYLGLQLPEDTVQAWLQYAAQTPCYGDRQSNLKFHIHERAQLEATLGYSLQSANYQGDQHELAKQLIEDSGLRAIAAHYLGTTPTYVASELLWSFPGQFSAEEQLRMAQVFHSDLDDYRSVKFFFYLTDVDEQAGPHVVMRSTHTRKSWLHQILGQRVAAIPDEALVAQYGADRVIPVCGKAGFGFVEDPMCFHKGTVPKSSPRLMVQIEYAINRYNNIRAFKV